MFRLPLSKLDSFFSEVAKISKLYLPVETEKGEATYKEWTKGEKYCDALNTTRSAKDFFFPQVQNLMDFKMNGKNIEIKDARKESEDFVVFGVRACDVHSFSILDRVFLSEPVDSCYQTSREHCTIISVACSRPDSTCFCKTFGIDATQPEGDIRSWITEKALFLEPVSEKGEELLKKISSILDDCGDKEVEAQKEGTKKILNRLPLADLKFEDLSEKQLETFKSEKWAKLSEACLGCGTCTFVCPTCQCYDIKDFDAGDSIKRFRCWDSCMYSAFTKMAAENPRHSQLERFRQRFMHKLVYFPMNNEGVAGCVGCGRCLRKCPISMNIVKVMKSLGEEKA